MIFYDKMINMTNQEYIIKHNNQTVNFKVDYQKELNAEQYSVVMGGDSASLVLAGAGSGKTRTLVYRVVYLLEKGVPAENIMLVTFTNKAAKEMLERIELVLGGESRGLWGGTFHHIGNRLLRIYGQAINLDNNFTILDEEDSLTLMKACLSQVDAPKDKYFPKAKVVKSIISLSVNLCQPIREVFYDRYAYLKPEYLQFIEGAAKLYIDRKNKTNSLDFDDLLLKWLELMNSSQEFAARLRNKFKYILVDEYQDTNYLQSAIIKALAGESGNILAVGDDSQSIYGFRGADVKNILKFPKIFKAAKIFHLDVNYRSSPEILALANHSINKNENKFEKNLSAIRKPGNRPVVSALTDNYQQAEFICQRILELQREENIKLNEIAVLFRSHFLSLEIEMEFNKKNIPYQMRGGLKFFEQAHLKDVSAYLKVLANFRDEVAWLRLLNMQDGIGEATADKIWQKVSASGSLADAIKGDFFLGAKAAVGWKKMNTTLQKITEINGEDLPAIISVILSTGYEDYLKANHENFQDRLADLEQLKEFIGSYKSLDKFLADTTLSENFKGDTVAAVEDDLDEAVVLSTIHQAKGLEWKMVFVVGLADGQFPHAKVYEHPDEMEEERRLFYVACTRAKDQLYLTYPLFGRDSILKPSQFIKEIPGSLYDHWDIEEEIAPSTVFKKTSKEKDLDVGYDFFNDEAIYVDEDGELAKLKKKKGLLDFDPSL